MQTHYVDTLYCRLPQMNEIKETSTADETKALHIYEKIKLFATQLDEQELRFPDSLSSEERRKVHQIAGSMGLSHTTTTSSSGLRCVGVTNYNHGFFNSPPHKSLVII